MNRIKSNEWVQDTTWYVPPTSDADVHIPKEWDITSEELAIALRPSRIKRLVNSVLNTN